MHYEAIVYGYVNVENNYRYVGYHKTNQEHDGYVFSSENYPLRKAWSHGLLRKTVIFRGSVADCVTLEHYILTKYDALANKDWYNQSNGGAAHLYPFNMLPPRATKSAEDWYNGISLDSKRVTLFADRENTDKIVAQIKSGYYEVVDEPVAKIYHLPKNQVRFEEFDKEHFENIRNSMVDDPADARTRVKPIIVCVMSNGNELILDGNHTVRAAFAAGWTDIPVIYINSSEFKDSHANFDDFGYAMNDRKDHVKGNSKDDCKRAILKLQNAAQMDLDDFVFADIAYHNLRQWSKKVIAGNLTALIKNKKQQELIREYNFRTWSKNTIKVELSDLLEREYPGYVGISINAGSAYNDGVGAIINKLIGDKKTKGLILVWFRSPEELANRADIEMALYKNIEKGVHPSLTVEVRFLDAYINTRTNKTIGLDVFIEAA
jgi:hypothetical protein